MDDERDKSINKSFKASIIQEIKQFTHKSNIISLAIFRYLQGSKVYTLYINKS